MDRMVFSRQMARLRQEFGDKKYSPEKSELIYGSVRHLTDQQFTRIVDDFIADAKFPPTRKDFFMAAQEFGGHTSKEVKDGRVPLAPEMAAAGLKILGKIFNKQFTQDQVDAWAKSSKVNQIACKLCDGDGLVFAKEKDGPYEGFAFKCICPQGKEREEKYPQWGASYAEKFALM